MSASHNKYPQHRGPQNLLCRPIEKALIACWLPLIWREAAGGRAATSSEIACVAESAASFERILLNAEILSPARNDFCWLCKRQAGACPWRGGCISMHL